MKSRLPLMGMVLIMALALGLGLASCGGDGLYGDTTTSVGGAETTAGVATTAGGANGDNQVLMQDLAFAPETITVNVGDTVTWTNKDSAPHTVVGDNGEFESESLAGEGTFSFTFDAAGTFTYHCGIHPSMTGTVIVQ